MALEAEFGLIQDGALKYVEEDILPPGTFRQYENYPGIKAFIGADNGRSLLQLRDTDGVFAIHFVDDADEEGEILWLEEKNIELSSGQQVCIGVNARQNQLQQEIWFTHTSSGNVKTSPFSINNPVLSTG